jgi:hypothetical protein
MPIVTTNFVAGRMNKSVDERILPPGEYVDAVNVRLGSTETTEIGAVENSKGNSQLTTLKYNNSPLTDGVCIGAYDDGEKETLYWFVASNTADMIVSFDTNSQLLRYHVVSTSVLNFNSQYLITGVNKIGDLLFFTDDINPPRKINVTKNYTNVTAAELNVIVQPPLSSPGITMLTQSTEANYLESRMVTFAYRYKYEDDEYSALSQFSDIAFVPGVFSLDVSTSLNAGMKNIFNAVEVSFNTGSSMVKGVDLCFKFANSNIINVIEKFDKDDFGWPDNSIQTQTFTNSKIYTTLPDTELLRLYDNVPLIAKGQTIMGNRLIYGNYEDGNDLIDSNGADCQMNFEAELTTQGVDITELSSSYSAGVNYTIDSSQSITQAAIVIDFSTVKTKLKVGALLSLDLQFVHNKYTGNNGTVTGQQGSTEITNVFTLPQTFNTVYEMASSDAFKAAIGTEIQYFQTVANCATGTSYTDAFNCSITNPADSDSNVTWQKNASGITALDQGFLITTTPGSDNVTIQIPAMKFVDSEAGGGTAAPLFEYFNFTRADIQFLRNTSIQSLHSNRNYEVGIVYMDEYLRSTTALVSPDNTVFVPASNSILQNKIKVTIPVTQKPPSWATKYKFVLKRAEATYETIYSNFYYSSTLDNSVFFKLEGQNQTKVKVGDLLRVKADSQGPRSVLSECEVLEVEAKAQNFLTPSANIESGGQAPYISELAGLYMQIKPTSFTVDTSDASSFFDSQNVIARTVKRNNQPAILIPCFETSPTGTKTNLVIPASSLITFDIRFTRVGTGSGGCGSKIYDYNRTFQASQDYNNLFDFVNGENIDFQGGIDTSQDDSGANTNVYINTLNGSNSTVPTKVINENRYQFTTSDSATPSNSNELFLGVSSGTPGCGSIRGINSVVEGRIVVQIANSIMIFETTPIDVDNDIYYEDDTCYDITNNFHISGSATGDQNQTASVPALVNLGFFDCFSFGNGVESFKVEDSLTGQSFNLGQRVTSVSQQDFKKADRNASLTYSGIYNEETNINRLNEFNLGLANFKDLEVSYGPIQILHPRETDILVLQEDKISYVLANKDLLSTTSGNNAVTASNLVLGTQVARVEEYGISSNPESFATYGAFKFFTDAKRASVIMLRGAGQQEQLNVVSDIGMRSYFRDLFIGSFNKFKLGGYDPYMDEYVLSSSDSSMPVVIPNTNCGVNIAKQNVTAAASYIVDFTLAQGVVTFNYNVSTSTVNLTVNWNGSNVISQSISGNGTLTFDKNLANPQTATVTITPSGTASYDITPSCPATSLLTVVQMTLGSSADENKFIHNQYLWEKDSVASPTASELITFSVTPTDPVTSFISTDGQSSLGLFPVTGSTLTPQSNKKDFDDFVFNSTVNKFKYLVSNTAYTSSDWATIDAAASTASPISNPSSGLFQATFNYSNPSNNRYLYLIWDYRTPTSISLRFGATSTIACCSGSVATFYIDTTSFATATAVYSDATLQTKAANQFYQTGNSVREQSAGALLPAQTCAACGTAVGLCYSSTSADDVCCTGCTFTSYTSSVVKTTRSEACGTAQTATYYHNGTGATPVVYNFVYSNSSATTKLGAGYYSLSATSVIYVNSNGMVENLLTC